MADDDKKESPWVTPVYSFKPGGSLAWAKKLAEGKGDAAHANENIKGGIKTWDKGKLCDVAGPSQLIFPIIDGKPQGAHLRLCTARGSKARYVPVNSGLEAARISDAFAACLKSKQDTPQACALKVAGKDSKFGKARRKR